MIRSFQSSACIMMLCMGATAAYGQNWYYGDNVKAPTPAPGVAGSQGTSSGYPGYDFGTSPRAAQQLWNVQAARPPRPTNPAGPSSADQDAYDRIKYATPPSSTATASPDRNRVAQAPFGAPGVAPNGPESVPVPSMSQSADEYLGGATGGGEFLGPENYSAGFGGGQAATGYGVSPEHAGLTPGGFGGAPAYSGKRGGTQGGSGFFFRWDRLWITIDAPSVGEVGDPNSAGVFFSNGITKPFVNSVSGNFIDDHPDSGDRIEFGFDNRGDGGGWLASVIFLDQFKRVDMPGGTFQFADPFGMLLGFADGNGDGIDDDLNGDGIFGRSGEDLGTPDPLNPGTFFAFGDGIPDTPAPQDNGDLVTWVPVFDNLVVQNELDISGFELTRVRPLRQRGPGANFLLGVRYVDIDERLFVRGSGSFLDETRITTNVENFIIGPQIGVGLCRNNGPWGWDASVRALAGVNRQRGRQTALVGTNAMGTGAANLPVNLNPLATSSIQRSTQFSPFFEIRADVWYNLTRYLSVRAGYTGWYTSGISRAAGSVEYSLPDFGFDLDNNDDLFANALTIGLNLQF